ncbi:MAG: prepilin-type N-terminal cleavage/methylation domain-containing protein [Candidatus Omnitrophica bacterium]|jgi:prepilin-type N-terminal cleavage/methylation domain-containing protein|nr:prepilin-type N-terminal cleavage/methylation domain-containing protein [Candidatus Omnitrophota bacterium]
MDQRKGAFTLIELIIVVVIIGILALVAIPKYFANVAKAQRSQVFANLDSIKQVQLGYYAAYGVFKTTFPINLTIDGETVASIANLSTSAWVYVTGQSTAVDCAPNWYICAYKQPGNSCAYCICTVSGGEYSASSCTP